MATSSSDLGTVRSTRVDDCSTLSPLNSSAEFDIYGSTSTERRDVKLTDIQKESKTKSKLKNLIPFYSTFNFTNRIGLKDKERNKKANSSDKLNNVQKHKEKCLNNTREEFEDIHGAEYFEDDYFKYSHPVLFADNLLYSTAYQAEFDDDSPQGIEMIKNIRSPSLVHKNNDYKSLLVRNRVAKKNTQVKCRPADYRHIYYESVEPINPSYHVNNRSYGQIEFADDCPIEEKECISNKKIYDEVKLIFDGEEIYAVREHSSPVSNALNIDSITLISDDINKSLNVSVNSRLDDVNRSRPDVRWNERSKFSRRSIRKSCKKKKSSKNEKYVERLTKKFSALGQNKNTYHADDNLSEYETDYGIHEESIATKLSVESKNVPIPTETPKFPEYAKVNKTKNKIKYLDDVNISKCTKDEEKLLISSKCNIFENKLELPKRKNSMRNNKVSRKSSYTCNSRPKVVKRPSFHENVEETYKTSGVKLRRKDSRKSHGRKSEHRLSITVQPSIVANLTSKFNSMINENQIKDVSSKNVTVDEITDEVIGRVYHSPRASFKRKYRTRTNRNRRSLRRRQTRILNNVVISQPESSSNENPFIRKISSDSSKSDNKTDEEKVCDKIETALSSGKFKGETDESESEETNPLSDILETQETNVQFEDTSEDFDKKSIDGFNHLSILTKDNNIQEGKVPELVITGIHQKTESIDSGILVDDHSSGILKESIIPPLEEEKQSEKEEVLESIGNVENVDLLLEQLCETEFKGDDKCVSADTETIKDEKSLDDKNSSMNVDDEANMNENIYGVVTSDLGSKCIDSLTFEDTQVEPESNVSLKDTDNLKASNLEEESEKKKTIYSTIFGNKTKGNCKKGKNKDHLKSEFTEDSKIKDKESWFQRGKSKDRNKETKQEVLNDQSKEDVDKCNETIETKDSDTKVKKNADGQKIYEKWIFKKLRERSEERKKKQDLSSVEVCVDVEDNVNCNDKEEESTEIVKNVKEKSFEVGYGLLKLRSRGRNKKKTKNSIGSRSESIENLEVFGSCSSPSSSFKSLRSRKLSDASVSTMESESISEKNKSTPKLMCSNSQRSSCSSIPPPPKTPIPSPPKSARIVLNLQETDEDKYNSSKDSSENIYENLYSPDTNMIERNRSKIEETGIVPNSSFLWNDGVTPVIGDTEKGVDKTNKIYEKNKTPFTKITGIKSFGLKQKRDSSLPAILKYSHENNYSTLSHISSDDSHTTASYDEIGRFSVLSYDDIRSSSGCSYDDVRSPSSLNYDPLKPPSSGGGYERVNPPSNIKSDSSQYDECEGEMMHTHRVFTKDVSDTASYLYDDINYNVSLSSHSYEPVNPPDDLETATNLPSHVDDASNITIIKEISEQDSSPVTNTSNSHDASNEFKAEETDDEENDDGAHEVFSYKLTRIGEASHADEISTASPDANCKKPIDEHKIESLVLESEPPEEVEDDGTTDTFDTNCTAGVRDSLRSSTSSYYSAYSSKYFKGTKKDFIKVVEKSTTLPRQVQPPHSTNTLPLPATDKKKTEWENPIGSRLEMMSRRIREFGFLKKFKIGSSNALSNNGSPRYVEQEPLAGDGDKTKAPEESYVKEHPDLANDGGEKLEYDPELYEEEVQLKCANESETILNTDDNAVVDDDSSWEDMDDYVEDYISNQIKINNRLPGKKNRKRKKRSRRKARSPEPLLLPVPLNTPMFGFARELDGFLVCQTPNGATILDTIDSACKERSNDDDGHFELQPISEVQKRLTARRRAKHHQMEDRENEADSLIEGGGRITSESNHRDDEHAGNSFKRGETDQEKRNCEY